MGRHAGRPAACAGTCTPHRVRRHLPRGRAPLPRARSLGFEPVFPLWGEDTHALASEIVEHGFDARVVCVDTQQLSADFASRRYDAAFLAELPAAVDPCGERGEFHTFVADGPGFAARVRCDVGETVLRDERFAFTDLMPATPPRGE